MELLIKEFLEILLYEKALHEELLGLALEKKDVLINNDVDRLKEIVEKERILLKKIRELETKRDMAAGKAAQALGVSKQEVTLDTIREHAEGAQKKAADEVKFGLISVVEKLSAANATNAELIKTHLDYTYFSIDMMTQSGVAADTYDNTGYMKETNKERIGLIDQKA